MTKKRIPWRLKNFQYPKKHYQSNRTLRFCIKRVLRLNFCSLKRSKQQKASQFKRNWNCFLKSCLEHDKGLSWTKSIEREFSRKIVLMSWHHFWPNWILSHRLGGKNSYDCNRHEILHWKYLIIQGARNWDIFRRRGAKVVKRMLCFRKIMKKHPVLWMENRFRRKAQYEKNELWQFDSIDFQRMIYLLFPENSIKTMGY